MVTNCKRKGKRKWIDKKPFLHLKPDFIFFFLFFWIDNKTLIERTKHRVHDGQHSKQETNANSSRTKANRL